jgi:hypothetical protein
MEIITKDRSSEDDYVNGMRGFNMIFTVFIGSLYSEFLIFKSYRLELEIAKVRRLVPPNCED